MKDTNRFLCIQFCRIVFVIICSLSLIGKASAVTYVKTHSDGENDSHHRYHYQLMLRAMEVTQGEFGPYKIIPSRLASSEKRQAEFISQGDRLNLHWGSPGSSLSKSNVIEIPIDILFGTQGYRICLINKNAFNYQINNLSELKKIKIGQGYSWTDLNVYQKNNFKTITAPELSNLYHMLGAKRFDCLPLGVNEIMSLLTQAKPNFPFLAIEPQALIKYDFPIYFYVSKKEPILAKRMQTGLEKLSSSGELLSLFQEYFAEGLQPLNLNTRKIICLEPSGTQHRECTINFDLILKKP